MACCSKRAIWKAVAIFSLVISCVYLAASICALLTYHCIFGSAVSAFQMDNTYFTYVAYFYNRECIDHKSDYIVNYPEASERTYNWSVAYLVVNSIWFFTSLLLLNAPNYWKTTAGICMTYPWLFSTFGVLMVDAAASVMYGLDYPDLETFDSFKEFVGLLYPKAADPLPFTYVPVSFILMIAIFTKLVIGWILIVVCFGTIYRIMSDISKPKVLRLQTKPSLDYYVPSSVSNPAFDNEMMTQVPSLAAHVQRDQGIDNPVYLDDDAAWDSQPTAQSRYIIPRVTTRDSRDDLDALDRYRKYQSSLTEDDRSWDQYPSRSLDRNHDRHPDRSFDRDRYPTESPVSWDFNAGRPKSILKSPQPAKDLYPYEAYQGQRPWSYVSPNDLPPHSRPHRQEYPYSGRISDDENGGYF